MSRRVRFQDIFDQCEQFTHCSNGKYPSWALNLGRIEKNQLTFCNDTESKLEIKLTRSVRYFIVVLRGKV